MDARRLGLVLATAAALVAMVGMHGMPLVATSTSGQQSVHATAALVTSHDHHGAPAGAADTASTWTVDEAPASHSHSLAHLCLVVLLGALSVLVLTLRRRPLATLHVPASLLRVRGLVPRAAGPPSLSELCLLRC